MVDAEASAIRDFVLRAITHEASRNKDSSAADSEEIEKRADELVWGWQNLREPELTQVRKLLEGASTRGVLRARGVVKHLDTLQRLEKTIASLERRREATMRNLMIRRAAGAWITPNWARSTTPPALRLRAAGR
jgi:hypothetical protein